MPPDSASPSPPADSPAPRRNQWQLPAFAAGLVAAVCAYSYFPPQAANPATTHQHLMAGIRQSLDQKPPDLLALDDAVRKLTPLVDRVPDDTPRARFLLGSARVAAAEYGSPVHAADNWAEANKHFAACDAAKLTDKADAARFAFRAAKAAAAVGVGDPQLLSPVLATVPPGEDAGEARRLLADTCLRLSPPDWKRARDELAGYLGGNHRSTPAAIAKYKLMLGDLSLRLNEPDKAEGWLSQIGTTAPPDVQAVAKVQRARIAAAKNDTAKAVKLFEEAQKTPGLPADQRGMVLYETGRGLQALNKVAEARQFYHQARTADGSAGVAASVRLAALAAKSPEPGPNPLRPAELLEDVVRNVKSAGDFQNPHVGVEELRATFEEVIQAGLSNGEYESAVRAVAAYAVVAPPGRARRWQAEAVAAWAGKLAAQGDATAAAKFQTAAADFLAAADEQTDPTAKADLFQHAADCLTRGGDKTAALDLYDRWGKTPGMTAALTAPALLAKADLLLAGGKFADAVDALKQASAAGGLAAARANLRLGRAELDESAMRLRANPPVASRQDAEALGDHGRGLLEQVANTSGEDAGEREVRQQALFDLGKHLLGHNLADAEVRLRQLMQSNPTGLVADGGRVYLGFALLRLARGDNNGGQPPTDADRKLTEAVVLFEELSKSKHPFYRTQGDIRLVNALLQLKKYDELPAVCDTLATRYKDRPEELIILSMLYTGHTRADRPALADRTLTRMTDAFARIPTSAYVGGMEELTQAYWTAWFDKARKR